MIVSLKTSGHDKIQKNAKTNDFTHVYGTQNAEVSVEPLHANKPSKYPPHAHRLITKAGTKTLKKPSIWR
jgi:hypothetical protein